MSKKSKIRQLNPLFLGGICHRGLHNETFTENGLKAFGNAIEHNHAFELDIHLSKDGKLIVCHDDELKRTTGKAGIIEELTYEEIKKGYRLLDGEEVPSFQEVLDLDEERVPIVVELKVHKGNYRPLAKAAKKILRQVKDKRNIWMISFDPRALLFMGHRYSRSLLVCKEHIWTLKLRHFFPSLDLETCLVDDKKVITYRKNHLINVWTVENEETLNKVAPYVDAVTFQHMDPETVDKAFKK
ncbi:MAG: hypothetical protein LKF75_03105 [Bacilli bacterium]|jgi:hypothetical protein|nr:hypothetical protein [Bacilli bacterium]MCH4228673.1 hypothetical protein [Bacilli bacterium]